MGKNIANAWSYTVEQHKKNNETLLSDDELPAMLGYLLSLSLFESAYLK